MFVEVHRHLGDRVFVSNDLQTVSSPNVNLGILRAHLFLYFHLGDFDDGVRCHESCLEVSFHSSGQSCRNSDRDSCLLILVRRICLFQ